MLDEMICRCVGESVQGKPSFIQSLWSGYGTISRIPVNGSVGSVVIKEVRFPIGVDVHDCGHLRKIQSFKVESSWYKSWSELCDDSCRSARSYGAFCESERVVMILEDLDYSGFWRRSKRITNCELDTVLSWLAHFHVRFLHCSPKDLWPIGTYWHLATRQKELAALNDESLRQAAPIIDTILRECRFQTIVHGDAKIDNFCFTPDGLRCAAVDFQYVGGGVGMKDLAYFIGSVLPEWECERREQDILDRYFKYAREALLHYKSMVNPDELEQAWRPLYRYAWADFYRFSEGWSLNYWSSNGYSSMVTRSVVNELLDHLS